MDFTKITDKTRNYNLHSHTQFCDGHAPMAIMAEAAVKCGMEHYGFTPHSPIPFRSPCNMSEESVEEYFAEVRHLSALPGLSACKFYTGMEIDYIGDDWGPATEYFRNIGLDYSIGSVHFIPSQDGEPVDIDGKFENFKRRMSDNFRGDIEYVVDTFYAQSHKMIESGGFDILGHFDKVGLNASYYHPGIEDSSFYRPYVEAMIDTIIDKGLTIELNTKALAEHHRTFPGERYLPRLVDAGITILVNSDSHQPDKITAGRAEGFAMLDRLKK